MEELTYDMLAKLPVTDPEYMSLVQTALFRLAPKGHITICGHTFQMQYGTDENAPGDFGGVTVLDELGLICIEPRHRHNAVCIDMIMEELISVVLGYIDKTLGYTIFGYEWVGANKDDTEFGRALAHPRLVMLSHSIHNFLVTNKLYDRALQGKPCLSYSDIFAVRKLRVGGIDYDVMPNHTSAGGSTHFGYTNASLGRIVYFTYPYNCTHLLAPGHIIQTIIHELLHCLDYDCGYKVFDKFEDAEARICAVAARLHTFLLTNDLLSNDVLETDKEKAVENKREQLAIITECSSWKAKHKGESDAN